MSTPHRPPSRRLPRITGRRLIAIRKRHLALLPLCGHCEDKGRATLATQLDHIISIERGGPDFDRDGGKNRQGLCAACHDVKTRKERKLRDRAPTIGPDGFPIEEGDEK
jgi:5-methylcytosine-specific restriction endonuclease McrA